MKVGIFDPYLDTLGGGEKYVLTAASCLSNTDEVDLFWDRDKDLLTKAQKRFGIDLSRVKLTKNIFDRKTSLFSRLIASRNYDLIIFLSDGSIPFVLTKNLFVHFQFPVEWVNSSNILTKLKLARTTRIICNSQFTKYHIDKKFGVESVVIYPPSDIAIRKQESVINKGNIILTVGRFGKLAEGRTFKKQDVMISVFKQMVDRGLSGWELVVVVGSKEGDNEEIKKLIELTKGHPIKICKNLNMSEISNIYKKAKIYWHAAGFGEDLEKHPERAEHFGMSTVEAMGAGAVPVVFGAGGQKEIVIDGVSGFFWNAKKELIEKTDSLIQNTNLWGKMSAEAESRAKIFSKDRFCRELKEIIK